MFGKHFPSFNFAHYVARVGLVAAVYALLSLGGLVFATPPGYVSCVFPAAGFAVFALMVGGYRHAVGIGLGALIANVIVQRMVDPSDPLISTAITAAVMAVGAALQAAAARYLVGRFLSHELSADQPSRVIAFVLLAGPAACVVSCGVGCITLIAAGDILLEDLLFQAVVFWLGDSIGVLLATPFLFAWMTKPADQRWMRTLYVSIPVVIGFVGAAAGYFYLSYRERIASENDFHLQADALSEYLAANIDQHYQTIDELATAAKLVDPGTSYEWRQLAERSLQRSPGMKSIAWHPWVASDERERFEEATGIRIIDYASDGRPAEEREYYLPTMNIVGDVRFESTDGADIATIPSLFEAFQISANARQAAVTGRIKWDQESIQGFGVVVLTPVVEFESLANPTGMVSTFIDIKSMIHPHDSEVRYQGMHVRVIDENAAAGESLLHSFPGAAPRGDRSQQVRFYHRANGDWKIVITADDSTALSHPSGASWWVLALGTILTALFGCMIVSGIGREAAIQLQVDKKTEEINEASEQLTRQVQQLEMTDRVLARERNLLRTIIDMLPSEVYVTDIEGRFLINNSAHLARIGLPDQNSAIGLNLADLGWCDAESQVAADLATIRSEEGHYEREESSTDGNGELQWRLNTRLPLRDGDDQIVGMVGVSHDVTERKQMEQSLVETERLMSLALKSARAGTFSWNIDNDQFRGDKFLTPLMHAEESSIATLSDFIDKVHPSCREDLRKCFEEAIAASGEFDTEFQLNDDASEETYIAVRGQVEHTENGSHSLAGVCWDITREKRAERELAKEQHLFKTLVYHIPDIIYFKNRQSQFIRVNRAMVHYLGLNDESDIVGKTDQDFYNPEHADLARQDELAIMETGEGIVGKEEYEIKADGAPRWVLTTKIPLFDDQGEIIGTCGVTRDISEIKKHAELLTERKDELETLLRISSHDLQEPLRSMRNFCSRLQKQSDELNEDARDFVDRIAVAAERMNRLVSDVAEISMAQTSVEPIEWVNGSEIVNRVLDALSDEIEEASANVSVGDRFPDFFVDRTWVTKAVYSLVENALKFVKPGEIPDVSIEAYNRNGEFGFVVHDRGPGVPEQHAERIFQLFKRTVGRDITGTGAGLAIARQVAKRHRGNAWVEEREGGGSTFILTLNHTDKANGK